MLYSHLGRYSFISIQTNLGQIYVHYLERRRLECNNFASSLMSQNRTQWNFRFPLATLFLERFIQVFVIYNEDTSDQHFLNRTKNGPAWM